MANQPLFIGLVTDENGALIEAGFIGSEPCYVINDDGFRRHVPAEDIDRAVLNSIAEMMKGSEDVITAQTAKMLGQEDPFSKAMIESQLKNIHAQFETLMKIGLPEEMRAYLGMMGFKIIVNYRGEVLRVEQPAAADEDENND